MSTLLRKITFMDGANDDGMPKLFSRRRQGVKRESDIMDG